MKKKIIAGILALIFTTTFCGCIEESKIIYVDYRGGADFTKIQHAIDNASEGDIIFVRNGTYYESLLVNKSIQLKGASKNQTIIDGEKSRVNHLNCVIFIDANNVTIKEFQITSSYSLSGKIGIYINSSYNTISNNILMYNNNGLNLSKKTKNNIVTRNTILKCRKAGITIRSSNNNKILKNNISSSGFYGIYMTLADNNIIFGNTVSGCDFYGVRIKASEKNHVYGNTVFNNKRGIYLCCGSTNNMMYYNNIIENLDWNAQDEIINQWDNGTVGNFWDDYNGSDVDGDGIGDVPYNVINGYGEANNKDDFPLMNQIDIKSLNF
jgi:parallel beta-helix repeat protein